MKISFIFLLFIIIGFGSFAYTLGYISDSGLSVGNVLSASDTFPSATPTTSPDPTATPTPANCVQFCQQKNYANGFCEQNTNKCLQSGGVFAEQFAGCQAPNNFCCCTQ